MSAATLTRQRCWIHLDREAAARCLVCTRFFCRECVTEHDGRVICAGCLRGLLGRDAARTGRGSGVSRISKGTLRTMQLLGSVALTWLFFQMLGGWLLSSVSKFHETSVWAEQMIGGGSTDDSGSVNQDKNDPQTKKDRTDDDNDEGR